jgi:hypothetical protein
MTAFEIREVPADTLSVDPRVQRVLDTRRVSKIAVNWDSLMVGVLTVSHRQNSFVGEGKPDELVVLDGQTRLAAFRAVCGQGTSAPVLAQVYEGLQLPEEAAMFLSHNDRKSVTPRDNFRLSRVAGEEWAEDVYAIGAKHNWFVQGDEVPEGTSPVRRYQAVSAAEKVHRLDDGESLRRAFETIAAAWPGQVGTVGTETLNGLGTLYARHENVDHRGLVRKLGKIGFNKFYSGVHDHRRGNMGISIPQAAYRHTLDLYNHGRRTQRLDV